MAVDDERFLLALHVEWAVGIVGAKRRAPLLVAIGHQMDAFVASALGRLCTALSRSQAAPLPLACKAAEHRVKGLRWELGVEGNCLRVGTRCPGGDVAFLAHGAIGICGAEGAADRGWGEQVAKA